MNQNLPVLFPSDFVVLADMSRMLLVFHNGRALQTSTSGIRSLRSWAHPAWNLWTDWWRLFGTTWWTNLSILGSASQSFSPTGLFLLTRSMTSWKVRYLINVHLQIAIQFTVSHYQHFLYCWSENILALCICTNLWHLELEMVSHKPENKSWHPQQHCLTLRGEVITSHEDR